MPTHLLRDSRRLHGALFSSAGSSFFLTWGLEIEIEIAWWAKTSRNWLEAFEIPVDGLVVLDVIDLVVIAEHVAELAGVVGQGFLGNQ